MATSTKRPRRRREITFRADGSEYKIPKPPRVDVLHYPRYHLTTILVRRTHDLEAARVLAVERWHDLDDERPFDDHRIGWWTTYHGMHVPAAAAEDAHGRIVVACPDTDPNASPGIEFRARRLPPRPGTTR